MEWAGRADHMGGVPRKMVIGAVGAFAKLMLNHLNSTHVHNADTLLRLVRSRPSGVPLITVSNHMSTLDDDDPLMWGFKGFPTMNADLQRWVLAAEDICFQNAMLSYFFRLVSTSASFPVMIISHLSFVKNIGKCIPITRGAGIYQHHMNEALDRLSDGEWLHTFPEGKVSQEDAPIRRLKWGTASLIARSPTTPLVLPIIHQGFEQAMFLYFASLSLGCLDVHDYDECKVLARITSCLIILILPEKYFLGRRPIFPLCNKKIKIVVGEPIEFDLPALRKTSEEMAFTSADGPQTTSTQGLGKAAQLILYSDISEQIQREMENLRVYSKSNN